MTLNIKNVVYVALIVLIFLGLLIINKPGPDSSHYIEWSKVFSSGNIQNLQSSSVSSFGIPVSQWSHGPGLLFLIPHTLIPSISFERSAQIVGWVCSIIFWVTMFMVFRELTRDNLKWTVLGLLLLFIGTPIGYYSSAFSSEILSSCFMAGIIYFSLIIYREKLKPHLTIGIGILSSLLIITRLNQIIFLIFPATVFLYKFLTDVGHHRLKPLLYLVLITPILFFGMTQLIIVNHWVTGSFFVSPYVFGNPFFKSMDYYRPEITAVLFSSLHGLLIYHPLYGLCAVFLLSKLFKTKSFFDRLLLLSIALITVLNIYINSAWYVWWLGFGTFGSRGFTTLSLLLIPVFIRYLSKNEYNSKNHSNIWLIFCLVPVVWSYFLLLQGNTNFFTYKDLLTAQMNVLIQFIGENIGLVVLVLCLFGIFKTKWRTVKEGKLISVVIAVLSYLTFIYFKDKIFSSYLTFNFPKYLIIAIFSTLFFVVFFQKFIKQRVKILVNHFGISLVVLFTCVFVIVNFLFISSAYKIEAQIKTFNTENHQVKFVYPANIQEAEQSYREYLKIPGYYTKKEFLKLFLVDVTHEQI